MAYKVIGGIHTDFTFTKTVDGKTEEYGPFESKQDAIEIWKAKMWLNVDNSLHRLRLVKV